MQPAAQSVPTSGLLGGPQLLDRPKAESARSAGEDLRQHRLGLRASLGCNNWRQQRRLPLHQPSLRWKPAAVGDQRSRCRSPATAEAARQSRQPRRLRAASPG
uniref:Uncharacterized protein n=1 Tax=Macrostomum lignano TaxID=282301 RepID=A0A1I8GIH4_9PLAT